MKQGTLSREQINDLEKKAQEEGLSIEEYLQQLLNCKKRRNADVAHYIVVEIVAIESLAMELMIFANYLEQFPIPIFYFQKKCVENVILKKIKI